MPKIWIDEGHGGRDPGNVANGHRESDLTLDDGMAVATHLIRAGAQVRLSRNQDVDVGLSERANMANDWGADIFVSIHINGTASIATGTETWHYSEKSRPLAAALQRSMVDVLGLADRGLKQKAFTVIYKTHMPAVLLEQFFLENVNDLNRYMERRENLRASIAKGILDYLGVKESQQQEEDMPAYGYAALPAATKARFTGFTGVVEDLIGVVFLTLTADVKKTANVEMKIIPKARDGEKFPIVPITVKGRRAIDMPLGESIKGKFTVELVSTNDEPFVAEIEKWWVKK